MTEHNPNYPAVPPRPPTWADYAPTVRNEDYLVALELLRLSPAVANFCAAAGDLHWTGRLVDTDAGQVPDADVDWGKVARELDNGTYLSSTEARLAEVVAGLTDPEWRVDLRDLARLGSWADQVWSLLDRWRRGPLG